MTEPMRTVVERVVPIEESDKLSLLALQVGRLNSDTFEGFGPETLMLSAVRISACLDWRSVRVRFELELDLEKFPHCSPPYRFVMNFGELMAIGREPAPKPDWMT